MKFAYLWRHGPGGVTFEKNHPLSLRHTMSTDGILMLHTQPANLLDIPVHHYPQKPPPVPYFDPPLPHKVWDRCKVTAIWLVNDNASKCPTHTTWHSRLRLRFTRIYLRFWARLTVCLNNKINCLFQADQPCFVHNLTPFLLIFTDTKTFASTPKHYQNIIHLEYELVCRIRL